MFLNVYSLKKFHLWKKLKSNRSLYSPTSFGGKISYLSKGRYSATRYVNCARVKINKFKDKSDHLNTYTHFSITTCYNSYLYMLIHHKQTKLSPNTLLQHKTLSVFTSVVRECNPLSYFILNLIYVYINQFTLTQADLHISK